MAIKLKTSNGNLVLTQHGGKVIRGIDGGYYTPVIDEEGNLSWIASLEDMNDVAAVNIMGPKGDTGEQGAPGTNGEDGESGVYVGTTEPTDDEMLIWINPEGTPSEDALATTKYVDDAIANAQLGGGEVNVDLSNYYTKEEVDKKIPDVSAFQTEEEVNSLISAALGEIENGSY